MSSEMRSAADVFMAPAPETVLLFFECGHLPEKLQEVSRPFCELATLVCSQSRRGPQRSVALQKLLEAKDAAVRAALNPGS